MATIFRERWSQLAEVLTQQDEVQRDQARSVIRSLIERIEIPAEGLLVVRGTWGGCRQPPTVQWLSVKVVAGARNHRYLQLWSGAA